MSPWHALISCPLAWVDLDRHRPLLNRLGVEVDTPDVPGQHLTAAQLVGIIDRYEAILAGDDELNDEVLAAAPRLRVISKWGVGVDSIDLRSARDRGIEVFNTPGVFADEVADYALGLILLLARRQHEVDRGVRSGAWPKPRGVSLRGKTMGIVGLGSSGGALARRCVVMGMRTIAYDPDPADPDAPAELVGLDHLLQHSDVVSLHLPGGSETNRLIGRSELEAMRPGAWLVNTSRGSLVDEAALAESLRNGHLGGAALDVYETEPLPTASPLFELDRVILGSHNASNTTEALARTTELALQNMVAGLGLTWDV